MCYEHKWGQLWNSTWLFQGIWYNRWPNATGKASRVKYF